MAHSEVQTIGRMVQQQLAKDRERGSRDYDTRMKRAIMRFVREGLRNPENSVLPREQLLVIGFFIPIYEKDRNGFEPSDLINPIKEIGSERLFIYHAKQLLIKLNPYSESPLVLSADVRGLNIYLFNYCLAQITELLLIKASEYDLSQDKEQVPDFNYDFVGGGDYKFEFYVSRNVRAAIGEFMNAPFVYQEHTVSIAYFLRNSVRYALPFYLIHFHIYIQYSEYLRSFQFRELGIENRINLIDTLSLWSGCREESSGKPDLIAKHVRINYFEEHVTRLLTDYNLYFSMLLIDIPNIILDGDETERAAISKFLETLNNFHFSYHDIGATLSSLIIRQDIKNFLSIHPDKRIPFLMNALIKVVQNSSMEVEQTLQSFMRILPQDYELAAETVVLLAEKEGILILEDFLTEDTISTDFFIKAASYFESLRERFMNIIFSQEREVEVLHNKIIGIFESANELRTVDKSVGIIPIADEVPTRGIQLVKSELARRFFLMDIFDYIVPSFSGSKNLRRDNLTMILNFFPFNEGVSEKKIKIHLKSPKIISVNTVGGLFITEIVQYILNKRVTKFGDKKAFSVSMNKAIKKLEAVYSYFQEDNFTYLATELLKVCNELQLTIN